MSKIKHLLSLFIVNHFLSFTCFFSIKRRLLIWGGVKIGKNTRIIGPVYWGSQVRLSIGENVWIGRNFSVEGNGEVTIGDSCDFGPVVTLLTGSHEIGTKKRAGKGVTGKINIGSGCLIGARAIVLPNVNVENMSVVAAGAVVKRNVAVNKVVAGVPAKEIRDLSDFTEEVKN